MEFILSDFEKYKAYFQALATTMASKGSLGAPGGAPFLFGDIEIGQEEAASWQGMKLWAWPPTKGRLRDPGSDNFIFGREAEIWIGGPATSEEHAAEDAFYQNCETLVKKLVAKMVMDRRNCLIAVDFNNTTFERADVHVGSTRLIGCRYLFTIQDPDGFEYDEDDWT